MSVAVLVMTDVQGSTRLWASEPEAMDVAMTRHHLIVHGVISARGGRRPTDQGEGDSVFAEFPSAVQALLAVSDIQQALAVEAWPTSTPLTVRIGIHAGEVIRREGNLFGDTVNRCARIRGVGHGGQSLVSSAVWELVRDRLPFGIAVQDLGDHQLKDLTRPERIWQLDLPGLATDFPALTSLDRARHNLPAQASSLVGRDHDVSAILAALEEHRLVTVLGFGGMGKTRVALQVGAELADREGDGVWFVDLSSITEPGQVPAEVARVLAVAESGQGASHAVAEHLQGKRITLLLDNLEQVLGCAPFVAQLLEAGRGVKVIATSREPLRVRGERLFELRPLALPPLRSDWEDDLASLSTYASVELFVQRARSVREDFAVSNETAPAVAAICARLDGLPLAIELAAARTRVLQPDALLARLDDALSLLTRGGTDRPDRHQTLRATIAWSYDALTDPERLLLDRLSVFPGPVELKAVEEICGGDGIDVLEDLTSLVDKSLVTSTEAGRYGQLVGIKEHAAQQLQQRQETAMLQARHAAWFRRSISPASGQEAEEDDRLVIDYRNVDPAWAWTLSHGSAEQIISFPLSYFRNLVYDGRYEAGSAAVHAALAAHPEPHRHRVLVMADHGFMASFDQAAASGLTLQALTEARALDEPALIARALLAVLVVASTDQDQEFLAEAERMIALVPDDALDPSRAALRREWLVQRALIDNYATNPGRRAAAAEYAAGSVPGSHQSYLAALLMGLSLIGYDEQQALQALSLFRQDVPLEATNVQTIVQGRTHLARTLMALGEVEEGIYWAQQAWALARDRDRGTTPMVALVLADLELARGDLDLAKQWVGRAAEAAVPHQQFAIDVRLLGLARRQNDPDHGERAASVSLKLSDKDPASPATAIGYAEVAWALAATDPDASLRLLDHLDAHRTQRPLLFGSEQTMRELRQRLA